MCARRKCEYIELVRKSPLLMCYAVNLHVIKSHVLRYPYLVVVVSGCWVDVDVEVDVVVSPPDSPKLIDADTFEFDAKIAFELFKPETTMVIVFPALELLLPLSEAAKIIVG